MAKVESLEDAPTISSLVRFEFQQAVWFEVWLHAQGPARLERTAAQSALGAFDIDLEQGLWVVVSPEWERIVARAERMALDHTPRYGARAMDILHLAVALEFSVKVLLSFDENQRGVAQAEGLSVFP